MWNCHSWPLHVSNNLSGYCISNFGIGLCLWYLYVYICTGISLYFLISWLFWMGSHWSHWTMKSSLCALAVLNEGVHHMFYLSNTDFSLYFPISWLFWMGSHWSHWTAKSSLCALAVLKRGVCQFYLPGGKSENLSSNEFYALLYRMSFHITYERPNECFQIYLLGNTINVCWNPQNRAHFSVMIDLRGHMPRFTLKMNVFPSISLESPEMCVETIRTGFVFMRRSIWGVTCLALL